MAQKIWSRPGNPTRAVTRTLGISREQLRDAIHAIKRAAGLQPNDRLPFGTMAWSRTTEMSTPATYTTKSDPRTLTTYASLRFIGDRLEPSRLTELLREQPTTAYRKGEVYKRSRGCEVQGRTGLWLLSTKGRANIWSPRRHARESGHPGQQAPRLLLLDPRFRGG